MYIGTSLVFSLYFTEYYARLQADNDLIYTKFGILSHFIPRTLLLIYTP